MNAELRKKLSNGGALKLIDVIREQAEKQKQAKIAEATKNISREILELAGDSGQALPDFVNHIDSVVGQGSRFHISIPKRMTEKDFRQHAENLKVALRDIAVVEVMNTWLGGCTVQLIPAP